jgi:hypothetical protein
MYKQRDLGKTHKVYHTIAQLQSYRYFIVVFVFVFVVVVVAVIIII